MASPSPKSPASGGNNDGSLKHKCKIVTIGDGAVGKTCMLHCYAHDGEFLASKQKYIPTIFENYTADIPVTNTSTGNVEVIDLSLWDTAGQDEFKSLRRMCYGGNNGSGNAAGAGASGGASPGPAPPPGSPVIGSVSTASDIVSVFLVCFAINSPVSFTNVQMKWYHELKGIELEMKRWAGLPSSAPRPFTVILVGTKSDCREGSPTAAARGGTALSSGQLVSTAEAQKLKEEMHADEYIECSSLQNQNVKEVIDTAVGLWFEQYQAALKASNGKKGKKKGGGGGKDDEGCVML